MTIEKRGNPIRKKLSEALHRGADFAWRYNKRVAEKISPWRMKRNWTYRRIAETLNQKGVRTFRGAAWTPDRVLQILKKVN